MKKAIVLIATLFSLCACQSVQNVCACTSDETVYISGMPLTSDDMFWEYTSFQRIDSHSHLLNEEGFKNVFSTYEEMDTYLQTLDEGNELAVYLNSLTPSSFEEYSLYISSEIHQADYNRDSLSLDVMFKKNDTIYVHFYRNYLYKSMNFWVYQCYTFFIKKTVSFNNVEIVIDNRF